VHGPWHGSRPGTADKCRAGLSLVHTAKGPKPNPGPKAPPKPPSSVWSCGIWPSSLGSGPYEPTAQPKKILPPFSHIAPKLMLTRTPVVATGVSAAHSPLDPGGLDWFQAFPFQQFHVLFTLSSECFSPFPHGTCSLSVSHPYLALDEVYHPFWAVLPNNPTL